MFQAIIHGAKRDELGAHYTSEGNIMKVIHGLFLDELLEEFSKVKKNLNKLKEFQNKIAELKFFDPACGCGNFLVIAYREMRKLEIEILKQERALDRGIQLSLDVLKSQIKLESFYGIEYDKSAVRITEVAMWLMEHKMNEEVTREFSKYVPTIPLQASPNITCGNSLRIDWNKTISKNKLSYIFGNPPFVSQENRNAEQREDMKLVFGDGGAILDYVCAWYKKAADYIEGTKIKVAFVSTNSITQGEQVGVLWEYLFRQNIKIHFAHRTFKWNNEAKGKASVYVVIIGFANFETDRKFIYDYLTPKSEPEEIRVRRINPYLIEFDDLIISDRNSPLSNVPKMFKGSQPTDGGNFLFTDEEKREFLRLEPGAKKFMKPLISSHEFINGAKRWCLWLVDAEPNELRQLPNVMKRVAAVKAKRLQSPKPATVKWAQRPTEFTENRQPTTNYILVPSHSSESRYYVPMGFMTKNDILNNSCFSVPNASLYDFGILTSAMHMSWMRVTCGRIKSDYRYSNTIVYNTFPFPENVSANKKELVEKKAQAVLDARANHPNSSLADLYDPNTMPDDLRKAHKDLDKAVDKCYGNISFRTEMERIKFLFTLYQKITEPLLVEAASKKAKENQKQKPK
jgi:hypothetical protein